MLIVLFVAALLVFAFFVGFARKETVRGRLRPVEEEARIYAPSAGIVVQLNVSLGQQVAKGQVLAEVRTSPQITALESYSELTIAALMDERATVDDRRAATLREGELNKQRLKETVGAEEQETERLKGLIGLTEQRIVIARERLESSTRLVEQGAASREEQRLREDALIVQLQQVAELRGRVAESQSRHRSAALELRRAQHVLDKEIADTFQRLAQIDAQMMRSRADGGYIIQAPVAGRVAAVQVAEGQRVDPSRPLLVLLPREAKLQAEVFVPSRAIAFIERGQPVKLRFDALPYQKFGAATGRVSQVSQTTFAPNEVSAPLKIEEPVYRVVIDLERQGMPAFGKEIALQAGMELSADIVLENRQLVEWLLEPVLAATSRIGAAQ